VNQGGHGKRLASFRAVEIPMRAFRLASLMLLFAALTATLAAAQWTPETPVAIQGRFVTMEEVGSPQEVVEGLLLIREGRIEAFLDAGAQLPDGCLLVKTNGYVYPGLINLHDHPSYNFLSLYDLPEHATNSHDWNKGDAYLREINNPRVAVTHSKFFGRMDEALKFAEVRAIVGGTTALQGAPGNPAIKTSLVRNVEQKNWGVDKVSQSALTMNLRMAERLDTEVPKLKKLDAWIVHLGEGIDDYARSQWSDPAFDPSKPFDDVPTSRNLPGLVEADLVWPGLVGVHCTALHAEDFAQWRQLTGESPKVVWSPASNLLLYGQTTNLDNVLAAGGTLALGTDWAPSGTKNLLWELKVADELSELSDRQLVELVTVNPAKILNWEHQVGRIRPGMAADLVIVDAIDPDPYRNLIRATETQVQLVFVGGNPLYGDVGQLEGLKTFEGEPQYEVLEESPAARRKAIDMLEDPKARNGELSFAEVKARLEQALSLDIDALTEIYNAGVRKSSTTTEYKARIAMLQGLKAKEMAANGEPVPEYLSDIDVVDREVTAAEVKEFIAYTFPLLEPLDGVDPLFTGARFFDAWDRNLHFQGPEGSPVDLRSYLEPSGTQTGIVDVLDPDEDSQEPAAAEFLSTSEAASQLSVTSATISRWARTGKIPGAVKEGNAWRIPAAWVAAQK